MGKPPIWQSVLGLVFTRGEKPRHTKKGLNRMELIGYYEMLKALEDVPDMEARNKARAAVAETVRERHGKS